MNFEPISRYKFEEIDRSNRAIRDSITVSYNHVTLTKSFYEKLGKPERILFGYDAEEKAFGVRVAEKDEANSIELRDFDNTVRAKGCTFLIEKVAEVTGLDLEANKITMCHPMKSGVWSVFEQRYFDISRREKRTKRSAE